MTNEKTNEEFLESFNKRLKILEEEIKNINQIIDAGAQLVALEDGTITVKFHKA